MRLTLRHRAVLEIMSRDDLLWDAQAALYRNGTDLKKGYEPSLVDDLYRVGLADRMSGLPTLLGLEVLRSKWPAWLPEIEES